MTKRRAIVAQSADLLRRANREGCTLLLGTCRVDRVGPVMAAVVAEIGIAQAAVVVVGVVVVVVVVAIAVRWIVVVVVVVVAIAWHLQWVVVATVAIAVGQNMCIP